MAASKMKKIVGDIWLLNAQFQALGQNPLCIDAKEWWDGLKMVGNKKTESMTWEDIDDLNSTFLF